MKKFLKVVGVIVVLFAVLIAIGIGYINSSFPKVSAAPDIKVELTPERIARGKYLAHSVALCIDCHSTRDWNKFAAPPVDGTFGAGGELFDQTMGFPGVYYSKNITPYGLKDWTDGEIYRAITAGVSKDGEPLFPVMPYHYYGKIDSNDVCAIIAYVRTLPEIKNDVPDSKSDFPFTLIGRTIPKDGKPTTMPAKTDTIAYGKYVATMSACIECHTKVEKGQIIKGVEYSGGRVFELPGGTLRSANITPHSTGIGGWTRADFIQRFKQYSDSGYVAAKLDFTKDYNSIMPWAMYADMEENDLIAIYEYLKTIEPIDNSPVKWEPRAN